MSEPVPSQQLQEGTSSSTVTIVETDGQAQTQEAPPTVHLKLRKPRTDRKVQWSTETVDNENMNKKKSKCCCIYDKPKKFGDSSSSDESDEECDHCHGHVERKKKRKAAKSPTGEENLLVDSRTTTIPPMEPQNPSENSDQNIPVD